MFRILSSAAAFLACSLSLYGQTAEQVISRHIEAMGGLNKLKSIQNVRRTETIDLGAPVKDKFVLIKKRGGKFRLETLHPGDPSMDVNGCDGRGNWWAVMQKSISTHFDCTHIADIDGPLVDYSKKGDAIKLVGKEDIEGRKAYDLKLTRKDKKGHPSHFYIDADTFLLVRILVQSDTEYHQETLSDYRKIDGIMVAFANDMRWWPLGQRPPQGDEAQVLKSEKDKGHQKQILDKIEFNVPLDDSIFAMPPSTAKK